MYDWKDTKKLYWKEDFPYSGNLATLAETYSKNSLRPKISKKALLEKMLEQDKE